MAGAGAVATSAAVAAWPYSTGSSSDTPQVQPEPRLVSTMLYQTWRAVLRCAVFEQAIAARYGVLLEKAGIALRGLFIINPEGIIQQITINDLVGAEHEAWQRFRVLGAEG